MAHNRYPNRRWMFLTSGDAATGVNFNQVMETSPATCRYNVAPTPGTKTFVKYHVTEYPQHSGNEPQISVFSGWHQNTPLEGGWVDGLSIENSGEDYGAGGNLIASGGGGSGFAGTFTQESGAISSVVIADGGEHYTTSPTIIVDSPDGSGATVTASLVSTQPTWMGEEQYPETAVQSGTYDTYKYDYQVTGSGAYLEWSKSTMTGGGWIDSLSIMNGGSGYSSDGALTASGGGGNGFAGTFTQDGGIINAVHIANSGEYYVTSPTVIIDGDGSGGVVEAYANPGEPTEPVVTGTGYYPLYTDNILGSGFFAASGQTTGQPDCFSLALEVEASGGNVTSLALISGGSGYNTNGNLTSIGGGGQGFAATFDQISGIISSVTLVSGGYGYVSEPTITATSESGANGTGALVSGATNSWSASGYEFDHTDMLNVLSGPDWTPTGIM